MLDAHKGHNFPPQGLSTFVVVVGAQFRFADLLQKVYLDSLDGDPSRVVQGPHFVQAVDPQAVGGQGEDGSQLGSVEGGDHLDEQPPRGKQDAGAV